MRRFLPGTPYRLSIGPTIITVDQNCKAKAELLRKLLMCLRSPHDLISCRGLGAHARLLPGIGSTRPSPGGLGAHARLLGDWEHTPVSWGIGSTRPSPGGLGAHARLLGDWEHTPVSCRGLGAHARLLGDWEHTPVSCRGLGAHARLLRASVPSSRISSPSRVPTAHRPSLVSRSRRKLKNTADGRQAQSPCKSLIRRRATAGLQLKLTAYEWPQIVFCSDFTLSFCVWRLGTHLFSETADDSPSSPFISPESRSLRSTIYLLRDNNASHYLQVHSPSGSPLDPVVSPCWRACYEGDLRKLTVNTWACY